MPTVYDLMSPELFTLRHSDMVGAALTKIMEAQITAAPVVDDGGVLVGIVSLRDLVCASRRHAVFTCMSRRVHTVEHTRDVEAATALFTAIGRRHLVVIDEGRRPIGMLSALDLLRACRGRNRARTRGIARAAHRDAPLVE